MVGIFNGDLAMLALRFLPGGEAQGLNMSAMPEEPPQSKYKFCHRVPYVLTLLAFVLLLLKMCVMLPEFRTYPSEIP